MFKRTRTFFIINMTSLIIIAFVFTIGILFISNNITSSHESSLSTTALVADHFISSTIDVLKLKASEAAFEIYISDNEDKSDAMTDLLLQNPDFIGMAVVNNNGEMIASAGEAPVSPSLINETQISRAFYGETIITTTIPTDTHGVVFFLAAPMPRTNDSILVLTLQGMYFSDILSEISILETGHIFIDDADGYIIANIRPEWVENRMNFIREAEINPTPNILAIAELVEKGVRGESGVGRFQVDGAQRMCVFRPISGSDEGWFLGVIAPTAEGPLRSFSIGAAIIGVTSYIISVIAAAYVTGILKKPFEEIALLKEAAEISSRYKSEFLANMSHEIRTPMNSIVGFSELALDDDISQKTKNYLMNIQENSEWLLQIINDILDISKIESGKMELENVPFDPRNLLNACRVIIMPKALEKGLEMKFYAEPFVGKLPLGDPTRLRQVLLNLLSNAVKFTDSGTVKFHLSVKDTINGSVILYTEIADTGIGMTREQINEVFSPFTQAETETTRKYGGTGLGLAITSNLLEMMGAKLNVESTPGVGSKFSFELTLDTIDIPEEELHKQQYNQSKLKKPTFKGEVLLCEDNEMNQHVICEHLERVGLKTVVAVNGEVAVELVKSRMHSFTGNGSEADNDNSADRQKKQFDLIFMDMHMPVMDGFEATNLINGLGTGVPIVAMTANIMVDDKKMYESSGMSGYIGKPFTSQELWRCLLRFFKPVSWLTPDTAQTSHADVVLQQRLIHRFVVDNSNKYLEIQDAISAGDINLAHRLVHTLKSNAGQLNKTSLRDAAETVENKLTNAKNNVTSEQMQTLETELSRVIAELTPQVREPIITSEPIDVESTLELLREIEPLLKDFDSECLSYTDKLRSIPGSTDLISYIENLDFKAAVKSLSSLISSLEKE